MRKRTTGKQQLWIYSTRELKGSWEKSRTFLFRLGLPLISNDVVWCAWHFGHGKNITGWRKDHAVCKNNKKFPGYPNLAVLTCYDNLQKAHHHWDHKRVGKVKCLPLIRAKMDHTRLQLLPEKWEEAVTD